MHRSKGDAMQDGDVLSAHKSQGKEFEHRWEFEHNVGMREFE